MDAGRDRPGEVPIHAARSIHLTFQIWSNSKPCLFSRADQELWGPITVWVWPRLLYGPESVFISWWLPETKQKHCAGVPRAQPCCCSMSELLHEPFVTFSCPQQELPLSRQQPEHSPGQSSGRQVLHTLRESPVSETRPGLLAGPVLRRFDHHSPVMGSVLCEGLSWEPKVMLGVHMESY